MINETLTTYIQSYILKYNYFHFIEMSHKNVKFSDISYFDIQSELTTSIIENLFNFHIKNIFYHLQHQCYLIFLKIK